MNKEIASIEYKDRYEIAGFYRSIYGENFATEFKDWGDGVIVVHSSSHVNIDFFNINKDLQIDKESMKEFMTGLSVCASEFKGAKSRWYKPDKTMLIPNLHFLIEYPKEIFIIPKMEFNYQEDEETFLNIHVSAGVVTFRRNLYLFDQNSIDQTNNCLSWSNDDSDRLFKLMKYEG